MLTTQFLESNQIKTNVILKIIKTYGESNSQKNYTAKSVDKRFVSHAKLIA